MPGIPRSPDESASAAPGLIHATHRPPQLAEAGDTYCSAAAAGGWGEPMSAGAASLAADMTPYVSAAVGAYGGAVLAHARDEAADATVGLGRRMLLSCLREPGECRAVAAAAGGPGCRSCRQRRTGGGAPCGASGAGS